MPNYRYCIILIAAFGFFLPFINIVSAQSYKLSGTVKDAFSKLPLSNVNIYSHSTKAWNHTNVNGHFSITRHENDTLSFQFVGYKKVMLSVQAMQDSIITVMLMPDENQLSSVTVTSGRKKRYSNKNNPAVELIRQVIVHKPENKIDNYTSAEYEKYAKLAMYVDRFPKWVSKNRFLKKYQFILQMKDTVLVPGKTLMPVYIEETISQNYSRKKPSASNSIVKAEKKVDYGEFIDTKGISLLFNRLFEDINIYDNNIVAFTKQFISPIADGGPFWYKYFIEDTIYENSQKLVHLSFVPRNTADMLFSGTMDITLDGRYAVKRISFHTDKNINLGVVRNFSVKQEFDMDTAKNYHLTYSNVLSDFGLYQKTIGMVGERTVAISGFKVGNTIDEKYFKYNDDPLIRNIPNKPDSFWQVQRPIALRSTEALTYKNVDSLHNMKSYRRATDIFNMFSSGYKTYNKFQIGPINNFLDYNPVEGLKPRIGGRTTPKFSNRFYVEGLVGYGLKDREAKYFGQVYYSLNKKPVYGYPKHYISVSSKYDTKIPGMGDDGEVGNLLLSVNSGINNRFLYNHILQADYLHELDNHLAFGFEWKYKNQRPGGNLQFVKEISSGADSLLSSIKTSELNFLVRWAPHEQFYQNGGTNRLIIPNRYPVFTFTYSKAIDGFLGGHYNYDLLHLNVRKRFYLSVLGVSDIRLDAGYLFGQVPWPLLIIHAGNQSLGLRTEAFGTMNYLEFVSDHYAALFLSHSFNGLFLNRVPLIKKLKWREIIGAKILYGGLRDENIPGINNSNLLKFPYAPKAPTYYFSNGPYIEMSAGISNIFKFLRVDVVKRMSYLDHPDIRKWSLKIDVNLEL